jgi:hypothetical protein
VRLPAVEATLGLVVENDEQDPRTLAELAT